MTKIIITAVSFLLLSCSGTDNNAGKSESADLQLLKNYRPQSTYNIPKTEVKKARYPVIDVHSHSYVRSPQDVEKWVRIMDETGIEKSVILTQRTGAEFDSVLALYSGHPDRFDVWCGFDYSGYNQAGFGPAAVAELERCYRKGAKGVGELGDKGKGLHYCRPQPAPGMHPDDPRMDPLFQKCAELGLPVNIHIADPIWMYQKMDSTNDGLMNALKWRLDDQPGIVDNPGMLKILEETVKKHPNTTFIACHFANQSHDLSKLGQLLDRYPNLFADISARFSETAPIPRFTANFYKKYQDRLLYGTDMGYVKTMYHTTFRILETNDEHFYDFDLFSYHWSLYGFGLDDQILKKVYRENALKILAN
jgi:predicted TIM-barrel fold metal-dependent hydrolase